MGRPGRPWRRKPSNDWYATVNRQQVRLAPAVATFDQAQAEWVRLKAMGADTPAAESTLAVVDLCDLFLTDLRGAVERDERKQITLTGYHTYLKGAVKAFGRTKVAALRPRHVKAWIDSQEGWGPTSRFNAITAIKSVFSWGRKQGYLESDPIRDMEKPTPKTREEIITPEQADAVLAAIPDAAFREFLEALRETGARPGEVADLTARMIDLKAGVWTVPNKTRKQTGRPTRTIYLTDRMIELSRKLAEKYPDGPVFRNRLGTRWTRFSMALRLTRLRKKLGLGAELTAYAFRHLFITDALDRGVPIATLAELVGHKNLRTIMQRYSKLKERRDHLRDAVRKARGEDA